MRQMVLATGNAGKLREFSALLAKRDIELVAQAELQVPEIAETGLSFVENAILKARNAARYSGLPAIADDSGLAVDALGGAPGIYSARYAGPKASDRENLEKLLAQLAATPGVQRNARFICVLAVLRHADDPVPVICQGEWFGTIAEMPRGSNGFGYDPVFYLPELDKTAAELNPGHKNHLSHRAKAMAGLLRAMDAEVLC